MSKKTSPKNGRDDPHRSSNSESQSGSYGSRQSRGKKKAAITRRTSESRSIHSDSSKERYTDKTRGTKAKYKQSKDEANKAGKEYEAGKQVLRHRSMRASSIESSDTEMFGEKRSKVASSRRRQEVATKHIRSNSESDRSVSSSRSRRTQKKANWQDDANKKKIKQRQHSDAQQHHDRDSRKPSPQENRRNIRSSSSKRTENFSD